MKKIILFCSALLLGGCVSQVGMQKNTLDGNLEELVLENSLIACSILPEASGLLAKMEFKPGKRQLFPPLKPTVFRDDLLPARINTGACGARELLWGAAQFHNLPMTVSGFEKTGGTVRLTMEQKFFGGQLLNAEKAVKLEPGTTVLHNRFTLTSVSKQPEIVTLWCNLIGRMGGKQLDPVLMPVKGGVRSVIDRGGWSVKRKSITGFDRDGVFLEEDSGSINIFTAPSRPWIALFSRETPGVLVMRSTPEALGTNAQFYSYKRGVRTMEMIFSPVTLQPGKSHTWEIDYIFFPSLRSLRDTAGCYGIDRRDESGGTVLEIEACTPIAAGKLKLESGKEYPLPALCPGRLHRLHLPAVKPAQPIAGIFPDGSKFQVNGLIK